MGYGILQQGQTVKRQAKSGIREASRLEENRNRQNEAIEANEKQAKIGNATAGATTGATAGATMASTAGLGAASIGVSALASGGIGLAAGWLLSELF